MGNQQTRQSFVFVSPPVHEIAPGATTPVSRPGATMWSSVANQKLVWTGESWQPQQPSKAQQIVTITASRTLMMFDAYKYFRVLSSSDVPLTVPTNSSVPFDIGTYINGIQAGNGGVGFLPSDGVVINVAQTLETANYISTRTKFSGFSLVKVGLNEWDLTGDVLSLNF